MVKLVYKLTDVLTLVFLRGLEAANWSVIVSQASGWDYGRRRRWEGKPLPWLLSASPCPLGEQGVCAPTQLGGETKAGHEASLPSALLFLISSAAAGVAQEEKGPGLDVGGRPPFRSPQSQKPRRAKSLAHIHIQSWHSGKHLKPPLSGLMNNLTHSLVYSEEWLLLRISGQHLPQHH